jgi:hypothetical protein
MGADNSRQIKGVSTEDQALESLAELVYQELRRMAPRYLRNERGNSLQATTQSVDVESLWREVRANSAADD